MKPPLMDLVHPLSPNCLFPARVPLFAWMEQSIRSRYTPTYPRLEAFLIEVGRRKFLTPLYRAMKETGQMEMALDIYGKARGGYHSVATGTMDDLLDWK